MDQTELSEWHHRHVALTAMTWSWTQGPLGVLQQKVARTRVVLVANSEVKDPEEAEEETQEEI